MEDHLLAALTGGCGRGLTVLCTVPDTGLLAALAALAGATGLLLAAGLEPAADERWAAVRCDPTRALPLRAHVVDAVVLADAGALSDLAEEVRRVLVPGGDVRVLLGGDVDSVESALRDASIRPLRQEAGAVLIARGP